MSLIKKPEEIEVLKQGGRILAGILAFLASQVSPGINTMKLEKLAREKIAQAQAEPAFLGYKISDHILPFSSALCVSIDDEIVHCKPASKRILKEGEIVSLDLGLKYKGLFTDAAVTVPVGKIDKEAYKLIEATKQALLNGLSKIRPGNTIGDIGFAIEQTAKKAGFGVVRELIGHGVGHGVHEKPDVPNYGKAGTLEKLVPGMVLAVEPMFTMGDYKIRFLPDGWGVVTADGSRAAHFEHTVAVTDTGCLTLTE